MRHACSAPRAKFRVLDWDAGWIWAWSPLLLHARALSLICTGSGVRPWDFGARILHAFRVAESRDVAELRVSA